MIRCWIKNVKIDSEIPISIIAATDHLFLKLLIIIYCFIYLWGINFAARSPNIGRPICVSDSLMDFFFRKTFSPDADTTLNSILPEKVAVNDLSKQVK